MLQRAFVCSEVKQARLSVDECVAGSGGVGRWGAAEVFNKAWKCNMWNVKMALTRGRKTEISEVKVHFPPRGTI